MLEGRITALLYSIAGLVAAWKTSVAFRLECVLSIVLVPVAFWAGESCLERAVLIAPVFLVLIVELVLSRLRSGLSTHLCGLSFECQGAFAIQ